jgi:hypothetical protein
MQTNSLKFEFSQDEDSSEKEERKFLDCIERTERELGMVLKELGVTDLFLKVIQDGPPASAWPSNRIRDD